MYLLTGTSRSNQDIHEAVRIVKISGQLFSVSERNSAAEYPSDTRKVGGAIPSAPTLYNMSSWLNWQSVRLLTGRFGDRGPGKTLPLRSEDGWSRLTVYQETAGSNPAGVARGAGPDKII